ncbi:GerAB/ArcD/ProY family transporter [Paenibacillus radicis (ex Xue et al. 2023)]|uniref:Spore germination protein n=1 Tax=Paenibacillus radicis (ex Xue et al. 2023) TaxID=2972489 RepID=A0ABT1YAN3_9BACL|nr:spore germination protein [Paenibacillus radicis (ex Xue et al. 2023)]MCR8630247.1 spore germination protein [Paenibacillus radicis (ex Xue et al. 2023)]
MKPSPSERVTVSPYLVFILIHSMQLGLSYLSMTIKPIQWAGQDAWISVLLCGLSIHVIIWMMYGILNRNETDLIEIHHQFFGKWAGGALNFIFVVYFLLGSIYQMRLFIEIIQVWIFPDIRTWSLALVLLLLVYYIVAGGFRVILGICMLSLLQHCLSFSLVFAAAFFHFNNLFPILDHSMNNILKSAKEMTFPYFGVEMLFFCYMFIKNPKKSQKWAHIGNVITTMFYLVIILSILLLFKPEQLSTEIWPELSNYKFVRFPFIEHIEFIGVSSLIFALFPVVCLCLWASTRMMKHMFTIKQLAVLPIFLILVFIVVCLIPDRNGVEEVKSWLSKIGFYIIYMYIPFLYIVDIVRMKVRRAV